MSHLGVSFGRFLVLGEGTRIDAFSEWTQEDNRTVTVEVATAESTTDDEIQKWELDCLVVDSGTVSVDSTAVIERWRRERPDVPVVLLTDEWSAERVTGALSSGATATLPRRLVDEDPELLADRLLAAIESEHGWQSVRELYDTVAGFATVHDPESGEMVHANQSFCELLGHDRDVVLSMEVGDFTADLSGYDNERAMTVVSQAVEQDGPSEVEWPVTTSDGSVRWVDACLHTARICGREVVLSTSVDITERKRREHEYEQIFNGVTEGIAILDPETGDLLDANQTFVDRLGYDDVEMLREAGIEVLSATQAGFTKEKVREICQRVMESGESETVEWQQETKDGNRIWTEATVSPAVIGGEDRVVSMQRDITKRRRREREYEQIFNSVNDAIAIFDPETADIVDVNDTYHEMLGYDDLETMQELGIEGLSVTEEGFTRERGQALVREAAETGQPKMVEWRGETRDGGQIWLEVTLARADIGGETRVLSMLRDITERKHREREYEQIFNDVTDAITVHDPETGRLLDVNDTMCELTGYDREALLGEGQTSINVAEEGYSTDRAKEIVQEVMEQNEKRTLEWLMERADGERRWLEVNATPTTLNGEERSLAIMRDVTEQRRTERRLREILERIDEAIYLTRAAEITNPTLRSDDLGAGYESIWGESLQGIFERYENGFFDTLHPDEVSGYKEFIDDLGADFDEGTWADRYSREYRIVRADRESRWVRSDFYPIEWPTGSLRIVIVSRDITDRKARERRIASFDDATDDLATADTPAEATRTAVTAATDSLNLPAIGAFLYDSDDGVLRPEVLEGLFPSEVATDPIAPGDGPLWEGFATGTIVGADSTGDNSGTVSESNRTRALAELTDWRAISLGNHGILLVGSPDDSLGSETIQSAHVLAATLEAALNHQRGQQQLADQEEQLRTQTERAERLDRIARLAQQVEAAITDTSNPGQVERAVCDRLVNAGAYDLAWIGGMDVGSVRLAPRSVVGTPEQYVAGMDLTTAEDAGDPHPAVTAWRTDEPRVADSLVTNGPAGDWRQRALSEGYQSLCAVPLTYDGVTHGVLTVGTDSPNTFGDRERDVLAQLGASIANALTAIQRRRALESDETVELEFHGAGDSLSFARAADAADCRIRHDRTVTRQKGGVNVYFNFEDDVPDDRLDAAMERLQGSASVVSEAASTLVEVKTDDWFGSPLAEYGGVLREATAEPGETTVTVEVPRQADVRSFVERLQTVAPSLELVAKRQHQRQDWTPTELNDHLRAEMTDRQFEVLETALLAGYFEWPRENDGSEVANRLDITQPTFNKHLRLAEKATFTLLFDADD